jgi:hypothetical protein
MKVFYSLPFLKYCGKIGRKARQFDINEMMAIAKRRAADAAEEKSKAKGESLCKCVLVLEIYWRVLNTLIIKQIV